MRLYEGEVDRCVGWRTYEYWDSHTVVSRTKAASEIPQTTMNSASSCPGCHTVCKRAHRGNGPIWSPHVLLWVICDRSIQRQCRSMSALCHKQTFRAMRGSVSNR